MGNLCPAQKAALTAFVADVVALFDELVRDQSSTLSTVAAIQGAKLVLNSSPDVLKVRLVQNWHEVAIKDIKKRSIEDMLQSDYLDVPGVVTGAQMLHVYNSHTDQQKAAITEAFERSIKSCVAFHAVPPEEAT
jgi:hypothetical protein